VSAQGYETPGLARHRVPVERLDPADPDLRAGQAGLAQALLQGDGHRGLIEVAVDHRGDVGTAFGLADLEFADGGVLSSTAPSTKGCTLASG
jgi:hypothetical protein